MAVRQGIIQPVNFKMGSKQVERLCQGEEVVWAPIKVRLREWLKSDGYSYINTGYHLDVGDDFSITLRDVWVNGFPQYVNNENKGYGQGEFPNLSGGMRLRLDMNNRKTYQIYYNGDFARYAIKEYEAVTERVIISDEYVHAIVYDSKGIELVNVRKTYEGMGALNLFLFEDSRPSTPFPGVKLISKVVIKRNGIEVIALSPCDIIQHPTISPQPALIDIVRKKIYTKSGSGQFVCEGADLGTIYL